MALARNPLSKLFMGHIRLGAAVFVRTRGGPKWYRRADRVPAEQKLRSLGRSRAPACVLSVPIRCGRILKRAMSWIASGVVCWRRALMGVVWVQRRPRSAVSFAGLHFADRPESHLWGKAFGAALLHGEPTIHSWSRTPCAAFGSGEARRTPHFSRLPISPQFR